MDEQQNLDNYIFADTVGVYTGLVIYILAMVFYVPHITGGPVFFEVHEPIFGIFGVILCSVFPVCAGSSIGQEIWDRHRYDSKITLALRVVYAVSLCAVVVLAMFPLLHDFFVLGGSGSSHYESRPMRGPRGAPL